MIPSILFCVSPDIKLILSSRPIQVPALIWVQLIHLPIIQRIYPLHWYITVTTAVETDAFTGCRLCCWGRKFPLVTVWVDNICYHLFQPAEYFYYYWNGSGFWQMNKSHQVFDFITFACFCARAGPLLQTADNVISDVFATFQNPITFTLILKIVSTTFCDLIWFIFRPSLFFSLFCGLSSGGWFQIRTHTTFVKG